MRDVVVLLDGLDDVDQRFERRLVAVGHQDEPQGRVDLRARHAGHLLQPAGECVGDGFAARSVHAAHPDARAARCGVHLASLHHTGDRSRNRPQYGAGRPGRVIE
jgi:hypothetical protein